MAIGPRKRMGSTRTITLTGPAMSGLPAAINLITGTAIQRVLADVIPALTRDLAEQAAAHAAAEARTLDLVHTEDFAKGFKVEKIRMGHEVVNATEYAGVIELGRRPGRTAPPWTPIKQWVQDKINPAPDDLNRVTAAVRRKIVLRPMSPKPVLRHAAESQTMRLRIRVAVSKHLIGAFKPK